MDISLIFNITTHPVRSFLSDYMYKICVLCLHMCGIPTYVCILVEGNIKGTDLRMYISHVDVRTYFLTKPD